MVAAKATRVLATVLVNTITMMWIHCVERCSVLIFFILGAKQLLCMITCWPFHKACNSPFPSAVPRVQSLILGQSGGKLVTPSNCTAAAASFLNEEVDSGCCDAQHFSWCCAKSSSSPLSAHSSLISFFLSPVSCTSAIIWISLPVSSITACLHTLGSACGRSKGCVGVRDQQGGSLDSMKAAWHSPPPPHPYSQS